MRVIEGWNGQPLRRQLWVVGGLLLLAGLLSSFLSNRAADQTRRDFKEVAVRTTPAANLLVSTDRDAYQAYGALDELVWATDPARIEELVATYEENVEQTLTRFQGYQEVALGLEGEDASAQAYLSDREAFVAAAEALLAVEGQEARAAAFADVVATFGAMRNHLDVIQESVYEPIVAGLPEVIDANRSTALRQTTLILAVLLLGGTAMLWAFARAVSRRVEDATADVVAATADLGGVADRLGASARDTAALAESTDTGSSQLAAHLSNLAAAVDEMSSSIGEISRSTSEVNSISTEAVGVTGLMQQRVDALGESSRRIGRVAEVVTAIAEQTNLLALNATIEAARAGEAGKGFAVVANEVKDLASETAKATSEIAGLIATIQEDSSEVAGAIAGISATIAQIDDLQTHVAAAIEEQSITTREIGRTVGDAANQAEQIAGAIRTVSARAGSTTEDAGTTRAAAARLQAVSSDLDALTNGAAADRPASGGEAGRRAASEPWPQPAAGTLVEDLFDLEDEVFARRGGHVGDGPGAVRNGVAPH